MVEVMKIKVTSFKRSHAHTATLSAPDPEAGHHRPTPQPETHRQVWVSLLWGHCSLLPGPGAHKLFVCAFQESVSLVLCKVWQLYGEVMVTSSKRAYAITRSTAPRASVPAKGHC